MSSFSDRASGLAVGDVVDGKYRIERRLGEGGMGVVMAALHLKLDRQVALKFLGEAHRRDAAAVGRMLREARAAAKLESEHVAKVLDVADSDAGDPYIVMEMLSGADLAEVLRQRGTLSVGDACDYLLQACQALAEAHQHGIVHRDLKPANLFLCRRADGSDLVKVLDFGISKLVASDLGVATATQSVFGSPLYMSPEQLRSSKRVDARADIWALGVMLFELLTGSTPFQATTVPELSIMIATEPPRPIAELRPDVPLGIVEIIDRCLQKDADRRYPSVGAFAKALAAFGSDSAAHSLRRISGLERSMASTQEQAPLVVPAATQGEETVQSPTGRAWGATSKAPPGQRRGGLLFLLGGAGVVTLGIAVFLLRSPTVPERAATPEPSAAAAVKSSATPNDAVGTVATPSAPVAVAAIPPAATPTTAPSASAASASTSAVAAAKRPAAVKPKARPRAVGSPQPESLGGRF
jgi:serine/threonine protein kinase